MIFKGLRIDRSWSGTLSGKFEVDTNGNDKIQLNLNEELCQKLIDVCADSLIETATEAAKNMKASVLEGIAQNKALLEHPLGKQK